MKIGVIGGGAAGFFAAITAKERNPELEVIIYEKTPKLLSKVKISGGGRCNLTNGCKTIDELCSAYPRGGRQLKKGFMRFDNFNTIEWFESRGVPLVIQDDNCVFPQSQDSQSIVDCLLNEADKLGVIINRGKGVNSIAVVDDNNNPKLMIGFLDPKQKSEIFDKIIVTTGGSPQKKGLDWLEQCGHTIVEPVPSLFSFNVSDGALKKLMGVVVEECSVAIQGTKIKSTGALLITHWGASGPAILKLSSYGARLLYQNSYNFNININWINRVDNLSVLDYITKTINENPGKQLLSVRPYFLPQRLWIYLLERCELTPDKRWAELGKKSINRLVNILTNDSYHVKGKNTFSEEYVTCGGVSLNNIDFNTMESKVCKNLYFAGEVLDIDAITGGYNLQAAWTTAYIAGSSLCK